MREFISEYEKLNNSESLEYMLQRILHSGFKIKNKKPTVQLL